MPESQAAPIILRQITVHGQKIAIELHRSEVRGLVDGDQVYGVYIDDPTNLRASTARAPSGDFLKSEAVITCMALACEAVRERLDMPAALRSSPRKKS